MRLVLAATILTFVAFTAHAADACKGQAAEKKLAGAAMTSFMKKCEKDAATACDVSAKEKKLSGKDKLHHEVRQRRGRDLTHQALFPSRGAAR
jgi:hypothetical protein